MITIIIVQMWLGKPNRYQASFYQWIQDKEYRKQHRLENNILNQKIVKRHNTKIENLKNYFKTNEKRLKLFGAFVFIFSLGFIYDWYLPRKHQLKKIQNRLKQLIFGTSRVYSKPIAETDKRFVYFKNDMEEQIGKYYLIIDRKYPKGIESVSSHLCSNLGIPTPEVFNTASFFAALRSSSASLQQIRDNIRLFSMSNQIRPSS